MGHASPSTWGSPQCGGASPGGGPDPITEPFCPTRRLHEAGRTREGPDPCAGEPVLRQWEDRRQAVSRYQPGEQHAEPGCRPSATKPPMRNGAVLSLCPVGTLNRHWSSDNVLEDETAARSDIQASLSAPSKRSSINTRGIHKENHTIEAYHPCATPAVRARSPQTQGAGISMGAGQHVPEAVPGTGPSPF